RELSRNDHLVELRDVFADGDVREIVPASRFDVHRKLLAVGGDGLYDHRIIACGSRELEPSAGVGRTAVGRILQLDGDERSRSAVRSDDVARKDCLDIRLSHYGEHGSYRKDRDEPDFPYHI